MSKRDLAKIKDHTTSRFQLYILNSARPCSSQRIVDNDGVALMKFFLSQLDFHINKPEQLTILKDQHTYSLNKLYVYHSQANWPSFLLASLVLYSLCIKTSNVVNFVLIRPNRIKRVQLNFTYLVNSHTENQFPSRAEEIKIEESQQNAVVKRRAE